MSRLCILIVEDESSTAADIRDLLLSMGHDVTGMASTGQDAVQQAKELKPDLVVMDILLPGSMDGIAAAEEIYSNYEIPVVYVTAYADENTLQRVIVSRAFGLVTKPVDESQLRIAIQMAALKHKLQTQGKEKQYWMSSTFESMLDGVISTDRAGIVRMINAAAETLTGWKKEEAYGRTLTEIFNVSMNRARAASITDTLVGSSVTRAVRDYANLTAKDGTVIPVQYSSAVVRDPLKNLEGFVLIFRNVTAERRLEVALNNSRRKYKQLIHTIDGIIWEADAATGRFLFVSSQAEPILGYPASRWTNDVRFWVDHIHPQDRSTVLAIRANRLEARKDYECEYRMIAADGRIVWLRDAVRIISEDNGSLKLRGFMMNITLRKWAEDSLRESEERFRTAFDYAIVGMSIVGTDGQFMRVNDSLCKILGYSQAELLCATFNSITHPDDIALSESYFTRMMKGELVSCRFEQRYIHRSGHIVWTLLSSAIIRNSDGKPLYFISQMEDITERKQALGDFQQSNDELEKRVPERTAELESADDATRSSEEKYRAVFEESDDVVSSAEAPVILPPGNSDAMNTEQE